MVEYLNGIFLEMAPQYIGPLNKSADRALGYSNEKVRDELFRHLPKQCQVLKLHSAEQLEVVNKHLDRYRRCCVSTTADHNNLIRAVLVQLKTTKGLTSEILRHQISEYMANEVVFFHPIMKGYLRKLKISYNAYIKLLYQGKIWADEFMLGAIGRMFNIKITVISPYYTDVWNVFHKSSLPDVIIVSNGSDFGSENAPTHFTATKGVEPNWKCVGYELNIGELGLHAKEADARSAAIDTFERTEKRQIAQKAGKLSEDIDGLCEDLQPIMHTAR